MPKGYWTASGQFLTGIGKPLGNAKIHTCCQLIRRGGRIARWLSAKMWQISIPFPEMMHFCLHLLKAQEALETFKNAQQFRLFLLFPTMPLLARLKLVRQSL
jgi:hypothetical protein